jgi:hypothetical protein
VTDITQDPGDVDATGDRRREAREDAQSDALSAKTDTPGTDEG